MVSQFICKLSFPCQCESIGFEHFRHWQRLTISKKDNRQQLLPSADLTWKLGIKAWKQFSPWSCLFFCYKQKCMPSELFERCYKQIQILHKTTYCVCVWISRAVRSSSCLSSTLSRSSASFETSSIPQRGASWQPPSPSSSWTWTSTPPPSTRYSWCSLASRTRSAHSHADTQQETHMHAHLAWLNSYRIQCSHTRCKTKC